MTLADLPSWFVMGTAVSLGLAFGSFLNVVIHRLPRGESLSHPPSTCPACGARIRARDNLPFLGWLFLRGRAHCCGVRISLRYPVVELLGGLAAWAIAHRIILEMPLSTPWYLALAVFAVHLALVLGLLAAIFIDLEHMILPDEITLGGTVLGLATVPLRDIGWLESGIGAAIGFFIVWLPFIKIYEMIRGMPGMGVGDAKLVMLAGAWFGWPGAVFALLAGAVQGTVIALVLLVTQGGIEEPPAVKQEREELLRELASLEGEERAVREKELALDPLMQEPEQGIGKARLAFGPFLALAILEFLFFGDDWIEQYLSWALGT